MKRLRTLTVLTMILAILAVVGPGSSLADLDLLAQMVTAIPASEA